MQLVKQQYKCGMPLYSYSILITLVQLENSVSLLEIKKFFAHGETGAVLRKLKIRLNRTVLPNYTEVVASNV